LSQIQLDAFAGVLASGFGKTKSFASHLGSGSSVELFFATVNGFDETRSSHTTCVRKTATAELTCEADGDVLFYICQNDSETGVSKVLHLGVVIPAVCTAVTLKTVFLGEQVCYSGSKTSEKS